MELLELQALIGKPDELQKAILNEKVQLVKPEDIIKQYDPKKHDITDTTLRPDKIVESDNAGTSLVKVARIPVPMQKRIVKLAAAFLCGNPIGLSCSPADTAEEDLLAVIRRTWKDNKLDFKAQQIAKLMMSETEVAELWYLQPAEEGFWRDTPNDTPSVKGKLRMRIIAPSLGDTLYPVKDASGNLIAFGRGFTIMLEGKKVDCFDVYTADIIYYFIRSATGWAPRPVLAYDGSQKTQEVNLIGKIPVIYYTQDYPEWYDVQEMIDRLEKLISNLSDTNDYHASPTIKVVGNVKGFAKKGESGRSLNWMEWELTPTI
jgi:hypothetical protein